MVTLRRTVRLCVNNDSENDDGANGYAGVPTMRGLGRYYELDIVCRGMPDPVTGYLVNIKDIDRAARATLVPGITHACQNAPTTDPGVLLQSLEPSLAASLAAFELRSILWRLTPNYSVELELHEEDPNMKSVLMRQRFDFAAAHRLHVPALTEEENKRLFGKCNNPSGHGHNYEIEPCVELLEPGSFSLADLERLTFEHVIDAFDHKHLNEDTADFATLGGLNPSVENIARICFDRLSGAIKDAGSRLRHITVWETDRTSCQYPG